jgi:hypothetical protein
VVKIATFAKPENVTGKRKKTLQTDNGDDKLVFLKSIQN